MHFVSMMSLRNVVVEGRKTEKKEEIQLEPTFLTAKEKEKGVHFLLALQAFNKRTFGCHVGHTPIGKQFNILIRGIEEFGQLWNKVLGSQICQTFICGQKSSQR